MKNIFTGILLMMVLSFYIIIPDNMLSAGAKCAGNNYKTEQSDAPRPDASIADLSKCRGNCGLFSGKAGTAIIAGVPLVGYAVAAQKVAAKDEKATGLIIGLVCTIVCAVLCVIFTKKESEE